LAQRQSPFGGLILRRFTGTTIVFSPADYRVFTGTTIVFSPADYRVFTGTTIVFSPADEYKTPLFFNAF